MDEGAEMAIGARTGKDVNIPRQRRPAKAVLRRTASHLAGTPIPNRNSGLRAIWRDLVTRYESILPEGFSFPTTITLASLTNHHRVDYVSIGYAPRSAFSKIRGVRATLGLLALIVRAVVDFNPLEVFMPLTGILLLASLASLVHDLVFETSAPNLGDKTVLLFVALAQTMTLGLVADLIDKESRLRIPSHDRNPRD